MFCDMRNFTRVSEQLTPEALRTLINSFFSTMTSAIRAERGTLDKYIGDAIMAFWGAPITDAAHAAHAVRAALDMTLRLHLLNDELRARQLPEIGVGIGLNSGLVCVGDMGSSTRRSYTVMGDAVNLASRIEGLTRHYGVDVLVGETTRAEAGDGEPGDGGAEWRWVEVDRVRVKGKQQSVTLFTPVVEAVWGHPGFEEEMRLWRLALASYRLQHWDEAQALLQGLDNDCADSALIGLYRQLLARTSQLRSTPPAPDWDGAHTFDNK
ncbi:MAG TPA: adenylate/guanylate cyclase domain-containing protein [Burkholderiaceae bacterium]